MKKVHSRGKVSKIAPKICDFPAAGGAGGTQKIFEVSAPTSEKRLSREATFLKGFPPKHRPVQPGPILLHFQILQAVMGEQGQHVPSLFLPDLHPQHTARP